MSKIRTSTFVRRTIFRNEETEQVVKSAQRVLEILEFFADFRCEASVMDVAEALGYPQSSTSALLRSLTALGYLQHDREERTFSSTPRVAMLAGGISNDLVRDGPLLEEMHKLADKTDETIGLVTRNGIRAQYIQVLTGSQPVPCRIGIGHSPMLVNSGAGHALLGDSTDAEIRRLVMRTNAEVNESTPIDYKDVVQKVRESRDLGYASHFIGRTNGSGLLAKRIPGKPGRPSLTISVFGRHARIREKMPLILEMMDESIRSFASRSN